MKKRAESCAFVLMTRKRHFCSFPTAAPRPAAVSNRRAERTAAGFPRGTLRLLGDVLLPLLRAQAKFLARPVHAGVFHRRGGERAV